MKKQTKIILVIGVVVVIILGIILGIVISNQKKYTKEDAVEIIENLSEEELYLEEGFQIERIEVGEELQTFRGNQVYEVKIIGNNNDTTTYYLGEDYQTLYMETMGNLFLYNLYTKEFTMLKK